MTRGYIQSGDVCLLLNGRRGFRFSVRVGWRTGSLSVIYPLTARVVGAPQIISQLVSSIFPCSPLPSGNWRTPGLSIPWCSLPTSSSVCLVFLPPFHCALQDGFGQTWWTEDMSIPLQFASLNDGQEVFVWSDCLLDLGTDFLVGNMVFVRDWLARLKWHLLWIDLNSLMPTLFHTTLVRPHSHFAPRYSRPLRRLWQELVT